MFGPGDWCLHFSKNLEQVSDHAAFYHVILYRLSIYLNVHLVLSAEPCIQMWRHCNAFSVTFVMSGCTMTVLAYIIQWSQRTWHSAVDVTLKRHILMRSMQFTFPNKLH